MTENLFSTCTMFNNNQYKSLTSPDIKIWIILKNLAKLEKSPKSRDAVGRFQNSTNKKFKRLLQDLLKIFLLI